MRYSLHHRTTYQYSDRVSYSQHLAHLCPLETPRQQVHSYRLEISPKPESHKIHTDYFQNKAEYFSLTTPHNTLEIQAFSEVNILPQTSPTLTQSPNWESVAEQLKTPYTQSDIQAAEYCFPSRHCPQFDAVQIFARRAFTPGAKILDAALAFNTLIHKEFNFDPKATNVTTSVHEVFQKKAGVCQDFAHFQITALRSLGLAARYVSGYIRTNPPPGKPRLIGADASHAWIALYVPGAGWMEYDATNNIMPSTNHITVAYGRDYDDICPIRGIVYGGGKTRLKCRSNRHSAR